MSAHAPSRAGESLQKLREVYRRMSVTSEDACSAQRTCKRPSALIFVPYLFHLAEPGPCPVVHYPGITGIGTHVRCLHEPYVMDGRAGAAAAIYVAKHFVL